MKREILFGLQWFASLMDWKLKTISQFCYFVIYLLINNNKLTFHMFYVNFHIKFTHTTYNTVLDIVINLDM
jgi:hypothetical protein